MRSEYLLHPQREPAPLLQAATLLLLRDSPGADWQVLMTRRSDRASFAASMYVFPGGGLESEDAQMQSCVWARETMPEAERVAATAAVRETWEEMGVLLAAQRDGQPVDAKQACELNRQLPLWPQLQARGWRLDIRELWQLAHWSADRSLASKRFAVPFFVARMPQGHTAIADETEQFEPVWVSPHQALQRHREGQMAMIFPTLKTLERLTAFASSQALLDAVQHGPLWRSEPRSGIVKGKPYRYTESDAPYGELAMVSPDGQIVHPLDWQSERAVPLRKNVLRLTAPNGGHMTGPGTNTYLVGEPATGYVVIDAGPANALHIERLWAAAGGDVRALICTHSHADHAPGAFMLQALCRQKTGMTPPIYGLPSASTARADSFFVPDRELYDGAYVMLSAQDLATKHTLRAVFTPGHAANHLCLLLEEDGLLFCGDHILNGSTTIIDGPDGNMRDYIDSLDKLDAVCLQAQVEFLLPAHGHVLAQPRAVIAHLKAHRLAREAKVLQAIQQQPQGSVQDWVAIAYADTPQSLWKLAERSLLAHMERIRALGLHHVTDSSPTEQR